MSLLNMLGGMAAGLITDRAAKYSNPMIENLFSQDPAPIEDRSTQAIPAQMQDVPTLGVVPEASMPPVSGYDLPPMPSGDMEINLPDFFAPEDDIGILAAQYDLNPGYVESALAEGMTIPDLREAAQLSDALYDGQKRIATIKLKKAQGEDTSEDESTLSKIGGGLKNFFGSEKGMLSMALAFNTLRNKPDNQLAAGIQDRLKTIGESRKALAMLPYIQENFPEFAPLAQAGVMTAKEIMTLATKNPTQLQQYLTMLQTPEGREQLKQLKEIGAIGSSTNINVDTKGAGKYNEKFAASLVGQQDEIRDRGQVSAKLLDDLNRFSAAVGNLATGKGEEWKKDLSAIAQGLGFNVNEAELARAQSVDAAAAQMVAQELRKNKGPQTDFDAEFTKSFVPSLKNLPETNLQIQRYMKSVNRLQVIKASYMDDRLTGTDYKSDNSTMKDVRRMETKIPAVAPSAGSPGGYIMFDDFYNAYSVKYPQADEKTIMRDWMRKIRKPVPEYLK